MSKNTKLDATDVKIIQALQINGRMSNLELSEQVNLSPSPCLRRTKILENSGVIKGYVALIDEDLYGFPLTLFVNIKLNSHKEKTLSSFEEFVQRCDEVLECYLVTGKSDYVLRVVCKNHDHYNDFVGRLTRKIDFISEIDSTVAYRTVKRSFVYPSV